jgi:hypothetical protein
VYSKFINKNVLQPTNQQDEPVENATSIGDERNRPKMKSQNTLVLNSLLKETKMLIIYAEEALPKTKTRIQRPTSTTDCNTSLAM